MALEEMDGSFGAITQTIKNLGIDNNTIIVFTSDNGLVFLLGQLSWFLMPRKFAFCQEIELDA